MKYILCDINKTLCNEWEKNFKSVSDVQVYCGSIFDTEANVLVSPANSFGFMEGGIDGAYSMYFDYTIEQKVQSYIGEFFSGELPIGCTVMVETGDEQFKYLLAAPTMRLPTNIAIDQLNIYIASKAIFNREFADDMVIAIPGLGTGVGGVNERVCAYQMRQAYEDANNKLTFATMSKAITHHQYIVNTSTKLLFNK